LEAIVHTKNTSLNIIFLELLSLTPLFILLGNIVPPFPIKLHLIGMGLIFVTSLFILLNNPNKRWYLYFLGFYLIIQFFQEFWNLRSFLDFFFGSTILICAIDIVANPTISNQTLNKYIKRFLSLLWIPIIIAILQFLKVIPITFWNATYINLAYAADGSVIPRPNGLLYHGSELSIIICFMTLFQFFKKEKEAFWLIVFLIMVSMMTYFKAIVGCIGLLFIYYLGFVNRGVLSNFRIITKPWLIFLIALGGGIISLYAINYFNLVHHYTGYYFPEQMLTGRGSIWNIYLDAIKDFSLFNYLFGAGTGSSFDLFTKYASPENFYPLRVNGKTDIAYDPHNAMLSIFIDGGMFCILLFALMYRMIRTQVKSWFPSERWNLRMLTGVIFIPLLTIGITIVIFDMAIYWCCLCFLLFKWKLFSINKTPINEH